ncbi:MAG: hypothetical protein ABI406_15550 [Ktedonobacteraceae bacterium]
MIVYVESNFILELALEQKEALAAENILKLAEAGKIDLAFPSFALSETFTSIMHTQSERQHLRSASEVTIKQLKQSVQSELHKQVVSDLPPILTLLTKLITRELELLNTAIERMLIGGRLIEIDASNFREALIYQRKFDIKSKDSIIYAAVLADLKRFSVMDLKCFLSRDRKLSMMIRKLKPNYSFTIVDIFPVSKKV